MMAKRKAHVKSVVGQFEYLPSEAGARIRRPAVPYLGAWLTAQESHDGHAMRWAWCDTGRPVRRALRPLGG